MSDGKWSGGTANRTWARSNGRVTDLPGDAAFFDEVCGRTPPATRTPTMQGEHMTRICFTDTETTSLRPDRRAWDIAIITREEGRPVDVEHQWFVDTEDLDLGNADLISLGIGRFHERHPQYNGIAEAGGWPPLEAGVMTEIEKLTRGAHLIDVEALAVGYLAGMPAYGTDNNTSRPVNAFELIRPPWRSDDLTAALGIKVSDEDKHTALGDARWARAIYDAIA